MSMINKTRLEEFANGLWAKIKTQIGDSVVNITFDNATSILTATKSNGQAVTVDLKSLIGVQDVTYDASTKTITVTKGDNTTSAIDLGSFVDDWMDLSHVKEITVPNLFNEGRLIKGGYLDENGQLASSSIWGHYITDFEIQAGQTYRRLADMNVESIHCSFLDANGQFIEYGRWIKVDNVLNKNTYEITIPATANIKKFTLNINHSIGQQGGLYLWDNISQPIEYIQYSDGANILIDGTKVSTSFDPKDSSIKSKTLASAIREVDAKLTKANTSSVKSVNNVKPSNNGNVQLNASNFSDIYSKTEVDNKFVLQTDVDNVANKIPRLGADGKLATSVLPKVSINETFQVSGVDQTSVEAEAMQQTVENGDMVVAQVGTSPNVVTKKYLCIDATKNTFTEKFIELTFPTDGITEGELQNELAKYVLISNTGTGANQVLRLDGEGKIDDANLKIATVDEINSIINALQ